MLKCYPPACLAVTKDPRAGEVLFGGIVFSGWILESEFFLASSPDMI